MAVKAGNYYKLKVPEWTQTVGQGEPPKAMTVSINDKIYSIPFGQLYKASATCDTENKIGNLDAKPYPLLHVDFITNNESQFEEINNSDSDSTTTNTGDNGNGK